MARAMVTLVRAPRLVHITNLSRQGGRGRDGRAGPGRINWSNHLQLVKPSSTGQTISLRVLRPRGRLGALSCTAGACERTWRARALTHTGHRAAPPAGGGHGARSVYTPRLHSASRLFTWQPPAFTRQAASSRPPWLPLRARPRGRARRRSRRGALPAPRRPTARRHRGRGHAAALTSSWPPPSWRWGPSSSPP